MKGKLKVSTQISEIRNKRYHIYPYHTFTINAKKTMNVYQDAPIKNRINADSV